MLIEEIIKYENENTAVDFKAIEYKKEIFHELLKDVIAMANATVDRDKYVICGVKLNGQEKEFIGLKSITDSAIYQQVINSNIEPELKIDYYPLNFENVILGILRISNCIDKPYMMKKDFGDKLKKGDCFIRKGSFTDRLSRVDLDNILSIKNVQNKFANRVDCFFSSSQVNVLEVEVSRDAQFPSDTQREEIQRIIDQKESELENIEHPLRRFSIDIDIPSIGGAPYEQRSISTLKKNLLNVKETYSDEDLFYLSETLAEKVNFNIINRTTEYLQDATIEILIEKHEGLVVLKKIYSEPISGGFLMPKITAPPSWEMLNYPDVSEDKDYFKVIDTVGDVKHNVPKETLNVPIRMAFGKSLINKQIGIKVLLHGKNLVSPLSFDLTISCF